ncbi:hypothetical protein GGTG_03817 [Gaeumannomyces tritici R3-111a-1]|uniref:Uncharacterized protein n=1 Tax=Gaeumannomyces tritici (strain R3-111a-1) TaxID=644352 RepID=J3NRB3_GAET3|nr:hypothetical protein GGTG_03817 [Gaeumannomyces tritici R3-111a-1]EJT78719.1 hypothetical protein GGTG_03817 [Gaeumannomyces tritici R3-111a-1]
MSRRGLFVSDVAYPPWELGSGGLGGNADMVRGHLVKNGSQPPTPTPTQTNLPSSKMQTKTLVIALLAAVASAAAVPRDVAAPSSAATLEKGSAYHPARIAI